MWEKEIQDCTWVVRRCEHIHINTDKRGNTHSHTHTRTYIQTHTQVRTYLQWLYSAHCDSQFRIQGSPAASVYTEQLVVKNKTIETLSNLHSWNIQMPIRPSTSKPQFISDSTGYSDHYELLKPPWIKELTKILAVTRHFQLHGSYGIIEKFLILLPLVQLLSTAAL